MTGNPHSRETAGAESRNDEARQVLTSGIAAAMQQRNEHARSEMETLLAEIS
jgi:hypothetical protein